MVDVRSKPMPETYPLFKRPYSYLLNRLREAVRIRLFSGSHNGVVFLPVALNGFPGSLKFFTEEQPGATPGRAGSSPCAACCRSAGGSGAHQAAGRGPGERVPNGERSPSGSIGEVCAPARPDQQTGPMNSLPCNKNPPVWGRRVGVGGFLPLLVNCPAWVIRPADEAHAYRTNADQRRRFRAAF